jgi:serine/threonine protein kinase
VSDRDDERPVALEPTAVAGTAQTLPGVAVAARAEPAAARDGLRPGTVVGRFVVERKVGAGGMGEVYAAYDPHLDRRVAIKILQAGARGADAATRLVREAQALAKLAHPNVVAVHEVGETAGGVFLAMQFVEGHDARRAPGPRAAALG